MKKGSKHSEEAKKKISESGRGRHHSEAARKKISESKMREKNHMWKGGRSTTVRDGYIFIIKPDHPFCDIRGYVLEHRLIMEEKIGRYLWSFEDVHHINGITNDNRVENLQIMTHGEHSRLTNKRVK